MKNFKLFLLAMCLWASNVFGQKYFFKQEYAPKSEYEMLMTVVSDSEMEIFQKKEKQSVKMIQEMKMGMNIKTDKQEDNKVPFVMKYSDFEMNGEMNGEKMNSKENPLMSMELVGIIENGNQMSLTEIKGKNINEEIRQILKNQSSQMAQFVVNFPKDGMMIGDTFVQKMPYSMNMPNTADLEMENEIEYRLKEVDGDKAYFDTKIKMIANVLAKQEFNIIIEGLGEGIAEFDTKINQFSKMGSDMQMRMTMDMGEIGKMTTLSDMKTTMQTKKLK